MENAVEDRDRIRAAESILDRGYGKAAQAIIAVPASRRQAALLASLDAAIQEMIDYPGPVLFDCVVDKMENCLPMIPSGKAHNEMILPDTDEEIGSVIDDKGKMLV